MTEKRFTSQFTDDYNLSDIMDNDEWIGTCHVDCADDFKNILNELYEDNEKLKQRINSRLHFYRELYEITNDKVVEKVIEDLEDILKR